MNKIDQINNLLISSPNDSFLQHALALEYIKVGEDEIAEKFFQQILERDPSYVGSYYHLGKLYERMNQIKAAINVYKNGMLQAKAAKDNHSFSELQAALEDIEE